MTYPQKWIRTTEEKQFSRFIPCWVWTSSARCLIIFKTRVEQKVLNPIIFCFLLKIYFFFSFYCELETRIFIFQFIYQTDDGCWEFFYFMIAKEQWGWGSLELNSVEFRRGHKRIDYCLVLSQPLALHILQNPVKNDPSTQPDMVLKQDKNYKPLKKNKGKINTSRRFILRPHWSKQWFSFWAVFSLHKIFFNISSII